MASIFTFQDEPHRVHSPWSTPGSSTPQKVPQMLMERTQGMGNGCVQMTKLEPEKHDGPTEYKLHLLLRPRRTFSYISTTTSISGSQQAKLEAIEHAPRSVSESNLLSAGYQPSNQTRQARLQQLTTQLLWRLQQSSPFHSSSNAKLVLPVLPEATPRLGVPDRPSKLLPGLEESQGALYEIGVADDGTLVGLAEEEIEESLTNLRAMAASLGCVVDVLRRVLVGEFEWLEAKHEDGVSTSNPSQLWVAEVLVRPDNKRVEVVPRIASNSIITLETTENEEFSGCQPKFTCKEQMRVTLVGASTSGKSSLLGTLAYSTPDNGRGKSRLSLLKHRHEIASGITSSVAQELVGYQATFNGTSTVINYASGDVSSWPDIHDLADRLVFFSDSPGLSRYAKSTFRSLLSWNPAWVFFCVAANDSEFELAEKTDASSNIENFDQGQHKCGEPELSLAHLEICLKLKMRIAIIVTKMDLAIKTKLRTILSKVLSVLKAAGRIPMMLSTTGSLVAGKEECDLVGTLTTARTNEQQEIDQLIKRLEAAGGALGVPILMTSAVTGTGIAKLHALLKSTPANMSGNDSVQEMPSTTQLGESIFQVDEVFAIPPSRVYSATEEAPFADRGIVLCGIVRIGTLSLGDELDLGPFWSGSEGDSMNPSSQAMRRAFSHTTKSPTQMLTQSLAENFSRSLQLDTQNHPHTSFDTQAATFVRVRIVSLRNLRLPVHTMHAGETGTVGVQPVDFSETDPSILTRARKGMILAHSSERLTAYRSFIASFPASDFGGVSSPPLILGGHAIVYVNSIRAAVKVIAVALDDEASRSPSPNPSPTSHHNGLNEVFSFDQDDEEEERDNTENDEPRNGRRRHQIGESRDICITFKFVSTVEYLEKGDQVLIIPTVSTAGPIAGPAANSSVNGLAGFVGRICDLLT